VVFDDTGEYLITADIIKYRHKITPYEGKTVRGVVERTYVRGTSVYREGELLGEPVGMPLLKHQL
jgi:allantoinase